MSSTRGFPGAAPASVEARGWGWRHSSRIAWAVQQLDFVIEPGERVLLLGASGAGKSTLLHGIAGVLGGVDDGEARGSLLVDGHIPRAGRAGLVLQDPDSQVILARVGDDVAFGLENLGVPRDESWRRVAEALDAVGLEVPLDFPTGALSGGQKQRLALAGVLAMRPGLLLLDEPTANLDSSGIDEVRDAVVRVAARTGCTVIVIEHRVDVWRDFADRVLVLSAEGGVLADGSVHDVLDRDSASLAASGVWVAGFEPVVPRHQRAASGSMLRTRDLAIARVPSKIVASEITLEVTRGQALAITGPNGSGKSTLGLTLGGLLAPASGTVDASGLSEGLGTTDPFNWRSRELLTRIGTVFQNPEHQFLTTTVRDELSVGPRTLRMPKAELDERLEGIATGLSLEKLFSANPYTLSGGEQRRLSVATAIITQPAMLVLDEPTFAQDARTWVELVSLLSSLLDDGTAIVAITHDEHLIDSLADSVFRMVES